MGVFQLSVMVKTPTPANNNDTMIALVLHKNVEKSRCTISGHVNVSERCIWAISVRFSSIPFQLIGATYLG